MADPIQIKNNRELHPQKISVKQYEVGTVLTFVRDGYKYDQIDLRDYKAYAITSFNGEIDYIELTKTVSGTQMTLTWPLSARTLLHEGIISYQIAFKADEDSAAVFNTYQGIIQNSASIDETSIVGDYPTIMKQWLDLIDTRSGYIPHKVEYMYPGKSIPLEERIADTLYYQWEEAHFTTATAATGVVYLGSNPYADSGLYINGKHVYVDDASDKVHVLEPSVWVDAINAANCGVIAMDNSSGDEIIILLTAATAGSAGNNITYELGLALYGAGAGIQNPSEGKTAGSKLTGGFDAQDGVENPAGYFEDHFGNKITPYSNLHELVELARRTCWMPDYTSTVALTNGTYSDFPVNAVGYVQQSSAWTTVIVKVDDKVVYRHQVGKDGEGNGGGSFLIPKGCTLVVESSDNKGYYAPMKAIVN